MFVYACAFYFVKYYFRSNVKFPSPKCTKKQANYLNDAKNLHVSTMLFFVFSAPGGLTAVKYLIFPVKFHLSFSRNLRKAAKTQDSLR